jgi:hypothetical protein
LRREAADWHAIAPEAATWPAGAKALSDKARAISLARKALREKQSLA